jgi:transcriptional regulator with XRE-family HTH domain
MGKDIKAAAQAFGERLRAAMREKGLISSANRSGVDVSELARIGQTTYEMARRYAEGAAIPRPDKLAAIASALGLSTSMLAYGEGTPAGDVNEGMLEKCLQAVAMAQAQAGVQLTPDKAAHLVAVLYKEAAAGHLPPVEVAALMVRAMA